MLFFTRKALLVSVLLTLTTASLFAAPVSGSGSWYGVHGANTNTSNYGYLGYYSYGAFGRHSSSDNYGYLGATYYGVYGEQASSGNYGFLGHNSYGAYGKHSSSGNVGALGCYMYGSFGQHSSANFGYLGSAVYGAYGRHSSTSNYGYLGSEHFGSYGYHTSTSNIGYLASNLYGVRGEHGSTDNYGYIGSTDYGVYGNHSSSHNHGYLGSADYGVFGRNYNNYGALGCEDFGVFGFGWSQSFAGYFKGDLYVEGEFFAEGTKNNVVKLDNGTWVTMTATEAVYPEYTTSGRDKLTNGKARIEFEHPYTEVVSDKVPLKVIVTPEGSYSGIYVTDVSVKGFTAVSETGDVNAEFSYLVIGRVKGKEAEPDYGTLTERLKKITFAEEETGIKRSDIKPEVMTKAEDIHKQDIQKLMEEYKGVETEHEAEIKRMKETEAKMAPKTEPEHGTGTGTDTRIPKPK